MKKEIAKNEYYEVYVDEEINRVYWVMRGDWKKLSDIPDYERHNEEVLNMLEPGFTVLLDLREMGIPAPEVLAYVTDLTKKAESFGLGRQAHILDRKSIEAIRTSRDVIKEAGVDVKMMQFGTFEEADEWLDR
jgi:hypothetical protein